MLAAPSPDNRTTGGSVSPPGRRLDRALRICMVLAAIGLATLALADQLSWSRAQEQLDRILTASGTGSGDVDLVERMKREPDVERAKIVLARGLFAAALDPRGNAASAEVGAGSEAGATGRRLETAADLARQALAKRPAAWDAAMVAGGATYFARSRARDRRLITNADDWERPMHAALDLAPGHPEPERLLALADLEVWFALSETRRDEARGLVARGLADPATFDRLIEPWLAVAPDLETAFALVPWTARAWERLEEIFARRGDWAHYAEAANRHDRALSAELAHRLADAEKHLAAGDAAGARPLFLAVAAGAPPDRSFSALFARALEQCPPGPIEHQWSSAFGRWLDWALDRALAGDVTLPKVTVARLARAGEDLEPSRAAEAELVAGELERAEVYERRAGALWSEDWAPYLVLKAELLTDRGDLSAAREALAQVHRAWQRSPALWRARLRLARAAEDVAGAKAAGAALAELAADSWPATAWRWHEGSARLELVAARPGTGFDIALDQVPDQGAALELHWDGARAAVLPVEAGDEQVHLPIVVAPGPHLLELHTAAGGRILPGASRLEGVEREASPRFESAGPIPGSGWRRAFPELCGEAAREGAEHNRPGSRPPPS